MQPRSWTLADAGLALLALPPRAVQAPLPARELAPGARPLPELARAIVACDDQAERRELVHEWLASAPASADEPLGERDAERVGRWQRDAREAGVELVALAGRYQILLCPETIARVALERRWPPALDAAYLLLVHLFGYDPVASHGVRVVHR